jgi:hypothetical protein
VGSTFGSFSRKLFCFRVAGSGSAAFQDANEFGDAAFEGGLLLDVGEIANDLTAQGGGHFAESSLGFGGVAESEDERGRENGFAGIFIALDGEFDDGAGVDAKFLADVTVNGEAVQTFAAGDEGGAERDAFDFALDGDVGFAVAEEFGDAGGYVDEADDADFVDLGREDVHGGE